MKQMNILKSVKICGYSLLAVLLLLLVAPSVSAQQTPATVTVSGIVYDEAGQPLPGVTVFVKNQITLGTLTDANGKFTIRTQVGETLVFTSLGYENVEYQVKGETKTAEIHFKVQAKELEEVVITSFQTTQRKISTVAAIATVDVKNLQNSSAPSMANLLGGRVAGVISMQTSGEPGKNIAEFWIRGIGTFGANAQALVLIDGLEGDLNRIDPADVESFSVLKDASATAVYGVRGANGVVLVTTKRGQSGKLNITGRVNYSVSQLHRLPKYLRAYDYAKLVNEALQVRGDYPKYTPMDLDVIRYNTDPDMFPDVSWQDEILRQNAFKQKYYLSAQGGADAAKYFVSLGMSKEDAAYNFQNNNAYASNAGYNTYNYRANVDLQLSRSATVFVGVDGSLAITNNPGTANTDMIWDAQAKLNPLIVPIRYSNGQYPAVLTDSKALIISPDVQINHMGRRSDQEYQGKVTLAYNQDLAMFLKGLKMRIQASYDLTSWFNEQRYVNPALYQATSRDAYGRLVTLKRVSEQTASYGNSTNQYRKYHLEGTINYEQLYGKDHRVEGLVYYYMEDSKKASDGFDNLSSIPHRYIGLSSRLHYGFRDTYIVDFNFGYTGSENFQPGRQFGFFPSVAIGWLPTGYEFVKANMPWMNMLKFRLSYGTVGNDRLAGDTRFPYLTTFLHGLGNTFGSIGYTEMILQSRIGADNLAWEKATKSDLGIDGQLLKSKVNFTVDFFNDVRDGIFQPRVQVPQYAGLLQLPYGNVGKMRSYGSDGSASYTYDINTDMSATIRGNYTYSKNNVLNWEEANPKYPYQENSGYPYQAMRGYQAIGLFKDQHDIDTSPMQTFGPVMPGDIKYRDINGDGRIDGDDRIPLSYNTYPMLMYGFGGEYRYKAFTVGILFQGTGKTDFFYSGQSVNIANVWSNNGPGYIPFYDGESGNVLSFINNPSSRWIPREYAIANGIDPALAENPNARFPRLSYGNNNNNSQLSTFWKGDSRYLRLKEITINYNYKAAFLRKAGIASLDLQLVGSNLYTWDRIKIFDPEQALYGGRVYPIPTSYAFQLYINL